MKAYAESLLTPCVYEAPNRKQAERSALAIAGIYGATVFDWYATDGGLSAVPADVVRFKITRVGSGASGQVLATTKPESDRGGG